MRTTDSNDTGFTDWVRARLREHMHEIEQLRAEIAEPLSRITQLSTMAEQLAGYLRAAGEPDEPQSHTQHKNPPVARVDISSAAYQILREEAKPLHRREIVALIEIKHAIKVPGKSPVNNLSAHLSKDARFTNVSRGIYGLAEWERKAEGATPAPQE